MVAPAVLLAILLVVLPGLLYVWAGPALYLQPQHRPPAPSTRIYDRTGTVLLAEIHQGSDRRHIVPLKQVRRRCSRRPSPSRTVAFTSTAV